MKRLITCWAVMACFLATSLPTNAREWTLQECIDYALRNNITIQKARIQHMSAQEDVMQSQAALLPSLSLSTSQNVTYRPWTETGSATVANGYVQSSADKVYYNGSYSINSNWTVWDGNKLRNNMKLNKMYAEQAALDSAVYANSIQEQILQLYIQILYSAEAVKVNQQSLETSKLNEERGKAMVDIGKMSKADLAQLTAQRAQDEYSIVEAESNLRNYKRQLKQLLQITDDEDFSVEIPYMTEEMALQPIPTLNDVYQAAIAQRPEIRYAQIGIESGKLSEKIAGAQRFPTITANAGAGTNTTTMSNTAWGTQLKTNFDIMGGVTISYPLFDNRQAKTAINKARLQQENYRLDLLDKQTTLYSTIESYWIQAETNQNMFKAAIENTNSNQASYDLLSEQFRLGLKNIIELRTGKDNLLRAKQNELQSKYLAILNIHMLKFYQTTRIPYLLPSIDISSN